jgi:hypothetical protein
MLFSTLKFNHTTHNCSEDSTETICSFLKPEWLIVL